MIDPIERQDAIDVVADLYWMDNRLLNFKKEIDATFDKIKALPSAQQDCTECEEYDHERHYCPRFCDVIRKTADELQVEASCKLPERKTGRWIPQNLNKSDGMISTTVYYYPKCSVCGANANYTNFCPNCGADMREPEDIPMEYFESGGR